MFIKQLLLCFWAYASCHVTCVQLTMNCEPLQASALFSLYGEFAVILIPTAALSPPFWALGWPPQLDHLSSDFEISHGLTLTLSAPSKFETTSLDSTSEGLLWLGTLSIHKGMSNSFSTLKMTLIISSLSSLAVFFCWRLLRYVPGGAPFSQLNKGVKDAMAISTKWCHTSSKHYKTCNKATKIPNRTIRKISVGRSQEARPCVQDEGSGEIPKESTYARVGKGAGRHECEDRGLWWNPNFFAVRCLRATKVAGGALQSAKWVKRRTFLTFQLNCKNIHQINQQCKQTN